MGERKGTNHYYPPDYDPKKGGLNKFLGTHALRERARKLHLGILIIRFEMPYNIWCDGCGNHIGMGVRYNAEKKKIGMYYSTPIYQFRMKCHLCDNHFEIKTDPANLDYVIVSGARRQENRWDPTENGQIVPEDKNTSKRLYDDAMFKLDHGEGDKTEAKCTLHASRTLIAKRDKIWLDDFTANSALRANFRARKRAASEKDDKDKALVNKFSLDIQLLPESESDGRMASLLSLTPATDFNERRKLLRKDIINQPVLPSTSSLSVKYVKSNVDSANNCLGTRLKQRFSSTVPASQRILRKERIVSNVSKSAVETPQTHYSESDVQDEPKLKLIAKEVKCSEVNMKVNTRISLVSSLYNDSGSD